MVQDYQIFLSSISVKALIKTFVNSPFQDVKILMQNLRNLHLSEFQVLLHVHFSDSINEMNRLLEKNFQRQDLHHCFVSLQFCTVHSFDLFLVSRKLIFDFIFQRFSAHNVTLKVEMLKADK